MRSVLFPALLAGCLAGRAAAQAAPQEPPVDSLLAWARRDSLDARAFFDLGMGYWSKNKFDQADTAFRRALFLAPHYAQPHLALALLPFGRGDRYLTDLSHKVTEDSLLGLFRASAQHYRQAYLLDPLVDPRILRYLGVDELVPRSNRLEIANGVIFSMGVPWWEGRTKRGVRALVEGRPEEAFTTLDEVLHSRQMSQGAILPDLFIWYYGLAAMHASHYDRAAAAFRELAQRANRRQNDEPDRVIPSARADYLFLYAATSEQSGNLGVAIPAFEEAPAADFGLYQAHVRLADIRETRGELDLALAERQRAIDTSPETGKLYLDLGVTLMQAGRAAPAESAFVAAAHLLPYDAGAQQFLAQLAAQNGHPDVARAALERFVVVAPARYSEMVADARRRLAETP
ncbi:MAG: tetratricopeptide repeat protein [Gemmatimonadetes bacterium]|nr:tetratricopeptide repeat protein [Gemmatimonadota bacterium]